MKSLTPSFLESRDLAARGESPIGCEQGEARRECQNPLMPGGPKAKTPSDVQDIRG